MRRRQQATDVRASLSAWYWKLSKLYDGEQGECAKLATALDAGEPVVLHAYEVDGAGANGMVRIEADGQLLPVEWDTTTRSYEVLS